MQTLQYLKKKYFAHKKLKKPTSKVVQKYSICFCSLLPWAAQTAQTEEFILQNVAYRPTVYKTGAQTAAAEDVGGPFHMQNISFLVNAAQMETSR